jgi:hypothetical protein
MAKKNSVQTLVQLDKSSPQFSIQLSDFLARREFDESIQHLQDDEVKPAVEWLDQVPSCHRSQSSFH